MWLYIFIFVYFLTESNQIYNITLSYFFKPWWHKDPTIPGKAQMPFFRVMVPERQSWKEGNAHKGCDDLIRRSFTIVPKASLSCLCHSLLPPLRPGLCLTRTLTLGCFLLFYVEKHSLALSSRLLLPDTRWAEKLASLHGCHNTAVAPGASGHRRCWCVASLLSCSSWC